MNMEPKEDWRDIVREYLQAYWNDACEIQENRLSGNEAKFISRHGSERMKIGHELNGQTSRDSLLPPPSEDCYVLLRESEDQMYVEVCRPEYPPNKLQLPIVNIRILLIRKKAGWQIDGIYRPCISCNLSAGRGEKPINEPGKCLYCHGTGKGFGGKYITNGFWPFRRRHWEKDPCNNCDGSGICHECVEEQEPGWKSVYSIDG